MNDVPTMLTIKDCASKTVLSYDFIRKLCLRNEIIHIKAGNKFLITEKDLGAGYQDIVMMQTRAAMGLPN